MPGSKSLPQVMHYERCLLGSSRRLPLGSVVLSHRRSRTVIYRAPTNVTLPGTASIPSFHCLQQRFYSATSSPSESQARHYSFEEIRLLSSKLDPRRIIIDVREPCELQETGHVPGAINIPITSNPDAFYLSPEDFLDRFGFEKPRARSMGQQERAEMKQATTQQNPYTAGMKKREAAAGMTEDVGNDDGLEEAEADEVIFYCKAGVRSRTAARMAEAWKGLKIGDMSGGWNEWHAKGGPVQRT